MKTKIDKIRELGGRIFSGTRKLDIIQAKISELDAELLRSTSGRDIYVFRSQGRIVFFHVIFGDDNDSTSYEALLLTSQDLVFKEGIGPKKPWSETIQAGLKALKPLSPVIEFEKVRESGFVRLINKMLNRDSKDQSFHYDFSFWLSGYPDCSEKMDAFINVGLALLNTTKKSKRLSDIDDLQIDLQNEKKDRNINKFAPPFTGHALLVAKEQYRMRRWSLGLGISFIGLAIFFGGFITFYGGMEGWRSSFTWTRDFLFKDHHIPLFFFLGAAVAGIFYLTRAYNAFQLTDAVTSSTGYIDFDRIRKRWPHRPLDILTRFLWGSVFTVVFVLVVLAMNNIFSFFMEMFDHL